MLGSQGGGFVDLSKVMKLKSYLAVGTLNMLLASCALVAAKEARAKRSEEDDDLGSAEMEGSGTETTHEGKLQDVIIQISPPRFKLQEEPDSK